MAQPVQRSWGRIGPGMLEEQRGSPCDRSRVGEEEKEGGGLGASRAGPRRLHMLVGLRPLPLGEWEPRRAVGTGGQRNVPGLGNMGGTRGTMGRALCHRRGSRLQWGQMEVISRHSQGWGVPTCHLCQGLSVCRDPWWCLLPAWPLRLYPRPAPLNRPSGKPPLGRQSLPALWPDLPHPESVLLGYTARVFLL